MITMEMKKIMKMNLSRFKRMSIWLLPFSVSLFISTLTKIAVDVSGGEFIILTWVLYGRLSKDMKDIWKDSYF